MVTVRDGQAGPTAQAEPVSPSDRVPALAWVIAAVFVAVELAVSARYGFLQDELYFIVAGHHLAFGYVDQPPLAPLLARVTGILGVSPTAVRIIPALAGGAIVVMAARLAALFGAGRFGRVLAALITACAPVLLGAVHIGNTTPLDLLAWTAVLLCVSTALLRHRPRWWLAAGAVAGLGLEADNLVVLLLIVPRSRPARLGRSAPVLRTRWPWLGGRHRRGDLGAEPHLAGRARLAAAGHVRRAAPAEHLARPITPARCRPAPLPGPAGGPLVVAGFVVLWRDPRAAVPRRHRHPRRRLRAGLGAGQGVLRRRDGARPCWPRAPWRPSAGSPGRTGRGCGDGLVVAACLVGMAVAPAAACCRSSRSATCTTCRVRAAEHRSGTPSAGRSSPARSRRRTRPWRGRASRLPRSSPGTTQKRARSTSSARPTTCRRCSPATTPTGCGDPGRASDRDVLVVDALGQLRPYFASCRLLTTYNPPYHVNNDWTDLQIGVCTGPHASWRTLWPHLKHYG